MAGSPARAGIDPKMSRGYGLSQRFPRTGGDRPASPTGRGSGLLVPPHGRG